MCSVSFLSFLRSQLRGAPPTPRRRWAPFMQELDKRAKSAGADSFPEVMCFLPSVSCGRSRSRPVLVRVEHASQFTAVHFDLGVVSYASAFAWAIVSVSLLS